MSSNGSKIMNHNNAIKNKNIALYFSVVGGFVTVYLMMVQNDHPLFSWATWDIEWVNAWLWMSVLDYYCCCACLSVIVAHTEAKWSHALAWITGFCLLGSPVCCAYVVYRCLSRKGLTLESGPGSEGGGSGGGIEDDGASTRYMQVGSMEEAASVRVNTERR